jgi:HAD superfamily hydrolase (TIGR01509 family)
MTIRHIIFDCDGVLVDSEPLSMELDWLLLKENGVNLSRQEVMQRFIGLTFGALVEQVERDFAVKLPPDLSKTKDARLLALFEEKLLPVDGARNAVAAIALPMSAASNSPKARVEAAFRIAGFARHFGSRITTFEDVKHGKPAPDIYIEAASRANTTPEACIAVEDSLAGVTSAAAAGCLVLGFTGTAHDPDAHAASLRKAGAAQIFFHMDELPALVSARQRP